MNSPRKVIVLLNYSYRNFPQEHFKTDNVLIEVTVSNRTEAIDKAVLPIIKKFNQNFGKNNWIYNSTDILGENKPDFWN